MQRRLASLAAAVDIGALLDQEFGDGDIPELDRELKCRLVSLVGALVDVAAIVEEDLHHGFLAGQRSAVEGRLPGIVVRIDVDTLVFKEEAGHLLIVDEDGVVQRRLVKGVANVDLGSVVDEDLGKFFETLLGSPVESRDFAVLMSLGDEEGGFEEGQEEGEVWTGLEEVFEAGFIEVRGNLSEDLVGEMEELHDRKEGGKDVYLRGGVSKRAVMIMINRDRSGGIGLCQATPCQAGLSREDR